MKTRKILSIAIVALVLNFSGFAQELAIDQNPNFMLSQEKYVETALANISKTNYVALQGTTAQNTYKAIDDMQIKEERKIQRRQWRQDRRMARIQNRNNWGGWGMNAYTPNIYNNNPYWGGYQNNYNPYSNGGYYRPNVLNYAGNALAFGLLGYGIYHFLK